MSEKEDKEGHPTQQLTLQQREPNPTTTEPTHCNNWTNPLQQLNQPTTTTEPTHCNNWPLPHPLPRREGRDHRDTPNVLLLVACGVTYIRVNRN